MPQPTTYRILVLDDDPIFRDIATVFLSMAGHEIMATASSAEALAELDRDPAFDLVLTDLNMPGLEGKALAVALRSKLAAATPLVGMSATQPSEETQACFDAFLLKPFDPQTFQDAIVNAIRSRVTTKPISSVEDDEQDASEAVLDETTFQTLARAIPHPKLRQLYDLGIADVEKRLSRMQEAAAAGDLATIHREAHAIKGSCGMVGALELQNLAAVIEDSTTFEASAMAQIAQACLRLRRMLDAKLQSV